MLQETADKFKRRQGHEFFISTIPVFIPECYHPVFTGYNAPVTDGNAVNILSQVFDGINTAAHAFTMNHPFTVKNGADCVKG